jgi:dehydrogenase/reductase SDR family protein 1
MSGKNHTNTILFSLASSHYRWRIRNMNSLKGKIALVTGASRGIGKGIAQVLGECGATVYITGRTVNKNRSTGILPGTIDDTADGITKRGGVCIAIQCDHRDDEAVKRTFDAIKSDRGRLDILVNNAWGGYENIYRVTKPEEYIFQNHFWTQPLSLWDEMHMVGLRSNYVASSLAAPIMIRQKNGLIVNISFFAGRRYLSNVAYGVCKAAVDRMSVDMAHELKEHNVSVVSLYPGLVRTEGVMLNKDYLDLSNSESPQFIGRAVAALAGDSSIISKTGKTLIAAEIALEYRFSDTDGRQPQSLRRDLW